MPAVDERKRSVIRLYMPIGKATTTKLAEAPEVGSDGKVASWIQVARTGEWVHEWYGKFELTDDDLVEMVDNFDGGKRAVMVDYNHASFSMDPEAAKAAGWAQQLETREDGTELWALVEWTVRAAEMIRDGEYRFISPEFDYLVESKEDKEILGTVLFAIGLCNRPFIEGMAPVELSEPVLLVESAWKSVTHEPTGSHAGEHEMDEARIRQILGLDEATKLTDTHRAAALTKLDEQLTAANAKLAEHAAAEPKAPDGKVIVDAAEHTELLKLRDKPKGVILTEAEHIKLKADAEAGRDAAKKLALKEREDLVEAGIRAGKLFPAERDDMLALAEIDFALVKGTIERRPKLVDLGAERGTDTGVAADAQKVDEFLRLKESEYRGTPHSLPPHQAYRKALSEAKTAFPPETYAAWAAGNKSAA